MSRMRIYKKSFVSLMIIIETACVFAGCSLPSEKKADSIQETTEIHNAPEQIRRDSVGMYIYSQLDAAEQDCYDKIYTGFMVQNSEIDVSEYSNKTIQDIYEDIRAEHAEIFWVNGYELNTTDYNGGKTSKLMIPNYIRRVSDIALAKKGIEQVADSLKNEVSGMNAYDKSKYLYTWICNNTSYKSGEKDQDIRSVFIDKESVCQGYASAYQYLLNRYGIKSFVVRGIHGDDLHAWVAAKIGDSWYYSDPTLGDAEFQSKNGQETFVDYSYFNMTEDECAKTHYSLSNISLPNGDNKWNSYFYRERLYFSVFAPDQVCERIQEEYAKNDYIILKFGSKEERRKAEVELFDEQLLSEYIEVPNVIYLTSGDKLIIFKQ